MLRTVAAHATMQGVQRKARSVVAMVAVAVCLAASACASGNDEGATDVGGGLLSETTAAPPDSHPPTSAAASRPPSGERRATTSTSAATGGHSGSVTTNAGGGGSGEGPADPGRAGAPGAYARALLRPAPATSIAVEVITQSGAALRGGTAALVEDVMEEVTVKEVTTTAAGAGEGTPSGGWEASAIVALAERHGRQNATSQRAVVRMLALRGEFAADDNAIGVAVRGDTFALFVDKINGATTPLVDATTIEQAVAVHEVGHLLGLVDIALDRNRDDPDHPFHSRNRGSVMFWAIETDLVGQILNGPPPRTFDRDDLDDLAALRAGA